MKISKTLEVLGFTEEAKRAEQLESDSEFLNKLYCTVEDDLLQDCCEEPDECQLYKELGSQTQCRYWQMLGDWAKNRIKEN